MSRDTRPCMLIYIQSVFVSLWNREKKEKKKKNGKEKEIRTEVHTFKYFEKNLSRFFTLYLLIRLKKTYFASLRYYRHWINFRKKYTSQASKIILFLRVQPSLSYFISIQSQKNSFCPKNNFLSNLLLQKSNRQEFKKKKKKKDHDSSNTWLHRWSDRRGGKCFRISPSKHRVRRWTIISKNIPSFPRSAVDARSIAARSLLTDKSHWWQWAHQRSPIDFTRSHFRMFRGFYRAPMRFPRSIDIWPLLSSLKRVSARPVTV